MFKIILLIFFVLAISACNSHKAEQTGNNKKAVVPPVTVKHSFAGIKMENKKDLSCGMPLTAGLEDTAHYKGKIYGFCSKECKEDFLKNPGEHIRSMQNEQKH